MEPIFSRALIFVIALMIMLSGCQKKTARIETIPQPPPAAEAPKTETPLQTPETTVFTPIDMEDAQRRLFLTVYFDFDRYDIRPDAIAIMERIAPFLKENPSVRVLAEGNCDERGSSEYNMVLGENRAKAVKRYLTSYGIDERKIETSSYGKERLARTGCADNESCHQLNRRVEWQVLANR
jgi:peptidoglycan-associated lipoprotein